MSRIRVTRREWWVWLSELPGHRVGGGAGRVRLARWRYAAPVAGFGAQPAEEALNGPGAMALPALGVARSWPPSWRRRQQTEVMSQRVTVRLVKSELND
jgi:hypothetical protein